MPNNGIRDIEQQIHTLMERLAKLQQSNRGNEVTNYSFSTLNGETALMDLFGERDKLLMIHNIGQGCRYCTLWADGFNGFVQHIESTISVVLVSKDPPYYSVSLPIAGVGGFAWHHTGEAIISRSSL